MPQLSQHVCFQCRKVFKKPHWYKMKYAPETPPTYFCPDCGEEMVYMGYKFRAPPKSDTKGWKRIEDGVKSGALWEKPTIRKEDKREEKISPRLKKALGIEAKHG